MSATLILQSRECKRHGELGPRNFGLTAGLDSPAIPAGVIPSSFILHPSVFFLRPPFHIGNVAIDFPVVQAALSGYSDWPMRVIARRLGAAYTLGEVLLDRFIVQVSTGAKARRYIRTTNEEHPVGAQLMGADPAEFPPAALKLAEAGFNVIDLNFGCPVKKVLGRCRGGFLLSTPAVRVGNRGPGPRCLAAAHSAHGEDAARPGR